MQKPDIEHDELVKAMTASFRVAMHQAKNPNASECLARALVGIGKSLEIVSDGRIGREISAEVGANLAELEMAEAGRVRKAKLGRYKKKLDWLANG